MELQEEPVISQQTNIFIDDLLSYDSVLSSDKSSSSKYVLLNKVGRGSYCEVFKGYKRNAPKKILAIKIISLFEKKPNELELFRSEIEILKTYPNKFIIQYIDHMFVKKNIDNCKKDKIDIYKHAEYLVIVTEFMDKGDFRTIIKYHSAKKIHMSETFILDVFVQILIALRHLHTNNILHHDIKPANILLDKSGIIKIADLGFAQKYNHSVSGHVSQNYRGTPYYMAPEIWNRQIFGASADIWALGVTLFESMNLYRPFTGTDLETVKKACVKGNVLYDFPLIYSHDLCTLCLRMLNVNQERRITLDEILQSNIIQTHIANLIERFDSIPNLNIEIWGSTIAEFQSSIV